MPANPVLSAWLYDVDENGTSRLTWPNAPQPQQTVPGDAALHVSVDRGQDSTARRYLRVPPAEGMASEPVTVSLDPAGRYWTIRNNGRTNTLRVQPYGLSAVPLPPQAATPMISQDVAVWIPVAPSPPRSRQAESFRLLILAGTTLSRAEPDRPPAMRTTSITAPRHALSPATREALLAYFGDHLAWPPLPAPHVRRQKEVEEIAQATGLFKGQAPENWARNRHDVLAGRDGLFTAASWYPRLGGPGRTIANHLAAFYRLVELRSITLTRVRRWAAELQMEPYVLIDRQFR